MVAESVVDILLVPQVDDGVAPHIQRRVGIRLLSRPTLQPDLDITVPILAEVLGELPVDRTDNLLNRLLPFLGVVDDRNNHGIAPLSLSFQAWKFRT